MNERIKELRAALKMSQEELGKWLGISKSGVSDIEVGRRSVTEQHILMLGMHDVNEHWLRDGTGEMFVKISKDEQIAAFIGDLLKDEEDSFKRRLITMLSRLSEKEWEVLAEKANELVNGENEKD